MSEKHKPQAEEKILVKDPLTGRELTYDKKSVNKIPFGKTSYPEGFTMQDPESDYFVDPGADGRGTTFEKKLRAEGYDEEDVEAISEFANPPGVAKGKRRVNVKPKN